MANCFSGLSPNECMETGPNTLTDITNVLLKWRSFQETLLYDLKKAYNSLKVGPMETHIRRFKWRESPQNPWRNFTYARVTFGDEVAALALELAKRVVACAGAPCSIASACPACRAAADQEPA